MTNPIGQNPHYQRPAPPEARAAGALQERTQRAVQVGFRFAPHSVRYDHQGPQYTRGAPGNRVQLAYAQSHPYNQPSPHRIRGERSHRNAPYARSYSPRPLTPRDINKKICSFRDPAQILEFAYANRNELNCVNIATVFHRMAKNKRRGYLPNDIQMNTLIGLTKEKIHGFNTQGLTNTAWAFATLGIRDDALLRAISNRAQVLIDRFKPQELANTAWAFATLDIRDDALLRAISNRAQVLIDSLNPQNLANTAWAFATLGIRDDALMRAISNRVQVLIDSLNPQNLANTAWAFATLGIRDDTLLRAISNRAQFLINRLYPQDLANTAWAFATLGIRDDALLRAISNRAQVLIDRFKSQELANTAWAFATLGIRDDALLRAISNRAQVLIDSLNPQNLANTAWAFATLGIRDDALMRAISNRAQVLIDRFNPQDLANTAWAFMVFIAISDEASAENTSKLIDNINFITNDIKSFEKAEIAHVQIFHQVMHFFKSRGIKPSDHFKALIGGVQDRIDGEQTPESSTLHKKVATTLSKLNISYQSEVLVGGYYVDILLDDSKVIIEVDGPFHFGTDCNGNKFPLGHTLLKRDVLKKLGYQVISVPYWDWDGRNSDQHKEYLQALLRT